MFRMLELACICVVIGASTASAQEGTPAAAPVVDSATLDVITTYSIKSGRIMLASAANPKPTVIPDGAYKNEGGTVLVVVDGSITRLERNEGEATEIASIHLNRDRAIMLTPSTNALMQVSDIRLPAGTFTSADGKYSLSVIQGRPTRFSIQPGS